MLVEFSQQLTVTPVPNIPGMFLLTLPVHGDNRGWFKENWQREKMIALGLPDFGPVQNNISFNDKTGTTRGIHAEPWDKYISVATGKIFGAWVDLREGESFGQTFTAELDAASAIFVPRGVGNSYQTLEDNTAYVYLVNDHWSADKQAEYTFLNLADETAAIQWPIPLADAELSAKDEAHPRLADVTPMANAARKYLVLGGNGQLGRALRTALTEEQAVFTTRAELDIEQRDASQPNSLESWNLSEYAAIINAAAYTAVDAAETAEGRVAAWSGNAEAVARLAKACAGAGVPLVHVSTDYVYDGAASGEQAENGHYAPLGVYGQSKAAGELAVSMLEKHYIVRTSWVIGDGKNFVETMKSLAGRGIAPAVVSDQVGRLTFAEDLAAAILHLVSTNAPYGIYNVSNDGEPWSWADVARVAFESVGVSGDAVSDVTTEEYFAGKEAAPRPLNSTFDLSKIKSTGFTPRDQRDALKSYLNG
ncbi:sugar nucleotide-binding protein [Neomicrococcus aestuarii]|uniref:dTDP-4-dehydrorhamnose reductase n=1 Tax=Neomicrococcus aestuarii TaxID=556325 RepID=A0A1L2ZKK9_9MICC|nr:bifunctional dTDP-4-dehydrorhamnose 3,5-epimerase family protein/NAD(P)-dependent oxidoreductase [Neomicrococcus aestuarii]APF39913.1 dTDP-4-dehydrorhamnose reductase [Neomicrococcus aestuarii]